MNKHDKEALQAALEAVKADPEYSAHLQLQLDDGEPWEDVACSAAYHAQIRALRLKPWQSPPMYGDVGGPEQSQARKLLDRMLAAGVSRYHPNPLAALKQVEKTHA